MPSCITGYLHAGVMPFWIFVLVLESTRFHWSSGFWLGTEIPLRGRYTAVLAWTRLNRH
ncbi:hypothetical protein DENSPDRAFT_833007 [Dentipellis sp. KUC8613]|nr:hypothetical protein DENSPDRAFT_833007 [Dentipellis sp. KUC8613]